MLVLLCYNQPLHKPGIYFRLRDFIYRKSGKRSHKEIFSLYYFNSLTVELCPLMLSDIFLSKRKYIIAPESVQN